MFYGRVQANFLKREMIAPECFPAGTCPAIRPVYRQTQGLNSRAVESAVRQALLLLPEQIRDPIPAESAKPAASARSGKRCGTSISRRTRPPWRGRGTADL